MIPNHEEHQISVVYLITNKINGKIYVGSATNLWKRYKGYKCTHKFESRYLARTMRKYGFDAFEFSILEIVENKDTLIEKEQYYIDKMKVCDRKIGYNISPKAGSSLGVKHSEKSKANMSKAQTGKKRTPEAIAARVASFKMNSQRVSEVHSVPVVQIDIKTLQVVAEHKSITAALRSLGKKDNLRSTIGGVCRKEINTGFGFYWAYKEDFDKGNYSPRKKIKKMNPMFYLKIRPVEQISAEGEILAIWETIGDASNGKNLRYIRDVCLGKKEEAMGFKWKYVEDEFVINRIKEKRQKEYNREKEKRDKEITCPIR